MTSTPDLDRLEATSRAAHAIAPGPWYWAGNIDHGDPALSCMVPGLGRAEVIGHVPVERQPGSWEAKQKERDFRDLFDAETTAALMQDWLHQEGEEEYGPNSDDRLAFFDGNFKKPARELAVLEVARLRGLPDDTPRDDERIYRGDVVAVNHPIAEYLAAANPEAVLTLIDRVRELEAKLEAATATC